MQCVLETKSCVHLDHLKYVLFSQHLLSSSMDKTVRLWDLSSKSCLQIFSHSDYGEYMQLLHLAVSLSLLFLALSRFLINHSYGRDSIK